MRPMTIVLAISALGSLTAACSVHEDRVVARPPAPAAVVTTPAPGAVVYTDPVPASRTTVTTVR
jgi:hypothetical protein